MSHVTAVTPAGPLTVLPGAVVDFDVDVTGVPADDSGSLRFVGSDGGVILVNVTVDRADLAGILTGVPKPNEVLGQIVTGGGTLALVGPVGAGKIRFRYTAAP